MLNKYKPIIKSIIYGLIIFAGSTYAANQYYANQIVYANQNGVDMTVDQALDDLYYASSNFANPTGAIVTMMSNEAPDGYLICDGTTYEISKYKKLADHIKEQFGSYDYFGGDGSTTFAVPDLRGEFLRGTGTNGHDNSGNGANVGEHQDGTRTATVGSLSQYNNGYLPGKSNTYDPAASNYDALVDTAPLYYFKISNNQNGTAGIITSRPTNTSVLYCIKY